MSKVESGVLNSIDRTVLVDKDLPKSWTCPHCGKRNKMSIYADETWIEFHKHIQHCDHCGYGHVWELKLTDDFKKKVVDMLVGAEE